MNKFEVSDHSEWLASIQYWTAEVSAITKCPRVIYLSILVLYDHTVRKRIVKYANVVINATG